MIKIIKVVDGDILHYIINYLEGDPNDCFIGHLTIVQKDNYSVISIHIAIWHIIYCYGDLIFITQDSFMQHCIHRLACP